MSDVVAVNAPDTVAVGTIFEVQLQTQGTDGCWRKGDDRVSRQGPLVVRITPYDREYVGTSAFIEPTTCTDNMVDFHHAVRIGASTRGTMEISVEHHLRAASGADSTGVIELSVHVR